MQLYARHFAVFLAVKHRVQNIVSKTSAKHRVQNIVSKTEGIILQRVVFKSYSFSAGEFIGSQFLQIIVAYIRHELQVCM